MYSEKVMDHFTNPRNMGEIENASGVGTVGNARCGDIMRIYLDIDDNQIIRDCKFKTFGCGAAVATSSMATELVKGKTIQEALQVTNKAVMEALDGLPPVKVHCSLLAEEAVHAALWDYAEKNGSLREVRENYLEETIRVTHMPSPSGFYSEKIASAFHLKEEGKEQVLLELGYPRNDELVAVTDAACKNVRRTLGIPEGKKVILYAPTWRENQHLPGEGYQFQLPVDFKRWREVLGDEYVILFRAHYFISNSFDFVAFSGFVYDVSQMDDINPLYLAADVLITDYSSVFFDYANLRRPILFFMYDYEQYKHEMRDFYFDIHMLPGPVLMDQEEVLKTLKNLPDVVDKYEKKYVEFNNVFNPHREQCSEKYLRDWMK